MSKAHRKRVPKKPIKKSLLSLHGFVYCFMRSNLCDLERCHHWCPCLAHNFAFIGLHWAHVSVCHLSFVMNNDGTAVISRKDNPSSHALLPPGCTINAPGDEREEQLRVIKIAYRTTRHVRCRERSLSSVSRTGSQTDDSSDEQNRILKWGSFFTTSKSSTLFLLFSFSSGRQGS